MRRIRVQTISVISIVITVVLGIACVVMFVLGGAQFQKLQEATETYIACENDARQLQDGSDYLTEQVRLATMTGNAKYIDAYFDEADSNQQRELALSDLEERFGGTDAYDSLQAAMGKSNELMQTEFYAMRLVCEANGIDPAAWPELAETQLTEEDATASQDAMAEKAQRLVSDSAYEAAKSTITDQTDSCVEELTSVTRHSEGRATAIFGDIYRKLEIGVLLFAVLTLAMCVLIRYAVVKPIMAFGDSIRSNTLFPIRGAGELQLLAETYNHVYEENETTQKLIKHQAEHDALTDLLNRGSFDSMLKLYDDGEHDFALILADVDVFKSVNDTYGHAEGDRVLKRVAELLKTAFRSIDHICRIGGDEFAIIMVEMTSDLKYTIREKIDFVNKELANPVGGMAKVSLSVGAAFSDRENADGPIFKDADRALYHTKENGRSGCTIYGDF